MMNGLPMYIAYRYAVRSSKIDLEEITNEQGYACQIKTQILRWNIHCFECHTSEALHSKPEIRRKAYPPGELALKFINSLHAREVAQTIAWSRRDFLRSATGLAAATAMYSFAPRRALALQKEPKVVVVTFGGGARDEETFAPEGQENIPNLLKTLFPQSMLYTQV